jgi:hypothetical protein
LAEEAGDDVELLSSGLVCPKLTHDFKVQEVIHGSLLLKELLIVGVVDRRKDSLEEPSPFIFIFGLLIGLFLWFSGSFKEISVL